MNKYDISRAVHSTEYYNQVEAKTFEEAIEKVRNDLLPDYEQIDDAEAPVENVSSTETDIVSNALRKVQELDDKEHAEDLQLNASIIEVSIEIVNEMVFEGLLPNCDGTNDETEFQAQDIIREKLLKHTHKLTN